MLYRGTRPNALPAILGLLAAAFLSACGGGDRAGAAPTRVEIAAENLEFDSRRLVVAADSDIIVLLNNRQVTAHNFAVYRQGPATGVIYKGTLLSGPDSREEKFRSPAPGKYYFRCDVHPEMNGEFVTR